VPGELVHRPWRNFGHNRSEALELARGKADYLLFIDADETLGTEPGAAWPALREPAYSLETRYGELRYDRVSLVDTRLPWRWNGVLHEYLDAGHPVAQPRIPGFWIDVRAEGARSRDPAKFDKDAAVLEAALADEPDNARYMFYLAQSYRDAGKLDLARQWYEKRASMGGWEEEAWYARYQVARLTELLGDESSRVASAYLRAYEARPARAEPLVALARFFRGRQEWNSAYLFANAARAVAMPPDRLFVDATAYGWWGEDERALAAFYTGRIVDAARIWRALLGGTQLPASERPRIEQNLSFTSQK
jgi:tetratricopeptide (TPR) repeat protein